MFGFDKQDDNVSTQILLAEEMFNLTKIFGIATLSTLSIFIYAGSAHAMGLRLNSGIGDNPNTEDRIETGQRGSFSDYYDSNLHPDFRDNAITIDFNQRKLLNGEHVLVNGDNKYFAYDRDGKLIKDIEDIDNAFVTYSLLGEKADIITGKKENGDWIDPSGEGKWAPSGPGGEINKSNYLQAGNSEIGAKIQIDFKEGEMMNYFGFNWGAISEANSISFVNTETGDEVVQRLETTDKRFIKVFDGSGDMINEFDLEQLSQLDNPQAVLADHHGEYNTFAHFLTQEDDQVFNRIIIEQKPGAGGFESDNHTFHIGNTAFEKKEVPEPSLILGMLAVGGVSIYQRRKQKPAYLS